MKAANLVSLKAKAAGVAALAAFFVSQRLEDFFRYGF